MRAWPRIRRSALTRGGAILVAVALLPVAGVAGVLILFGVLGAQPPDAAMPDGDPCCAYPDTWGDVGGSLLETAAMGAAFGAALWSIYLLVRWAFSANPAEPMRWRSILAGGATITTVFFSAVLAITAVARLGNL